MEFKTLFGSGDDHTDEDAETGRKSHSSEFMLQYGWHYSVQLVAEYERIRTDDAWQLTTIHFLNDLAYLKAKANYDKEQQAKALNPHAIHH